MPASANVSAIAGLNDGSPVINIISNDVASIEAGKGQVQVYHAANAPAVDILVNGGPDLSGLAPGASAAADVPARSYDFAVVIAGTTAPVLSNLPGRRSPPASCCRCSRSASQAARPTRSR
ncbi:MAG: hypothetical protein U0W40_10755 [Acidimicrobiia bacterium]